MAESWDLEVEPLVVAIGDASHELREVLRGLQANPRLTDWERGFVDSVADQYDRRGVLSPKQADVLNKIRARLGAPVDSTLASKLESAGELPLTAWERGFLYSLREQFARRGSLSEKQISTLDRILGQQSAGNREPQFGEVDLSRVPAGTYQVESGRQFEISKPGPGSKWFGWTFVKGETGAKAGSQRPGCAYTGGYVEEMRQIAADPKAAAIAYGRATGQCGVCGRELTDPNSIAAGIGPVCASRF